MPHACKSTPGCGTVRQVTGSLPFALALCVVAAFAWDGFRRWVARTGQATTRDVLDRLGAVEKGLAKLDAEVGRAAPAPRGQLSGIRGR